MNSSSRNLLLIAGFAGLTASFVAGCGDHSSPGTERPDWDHKRDALSNGLVISQVYGSGANLTATWRNDYVEIFNRGGTAVTMTNWSLQYQTNAGQTWTVLATLNGTVPAYSYYLVQLGTSGGTDGGTLPTPQATSTQNISGAQGKLALVSSNTALANGCPAAGLTVDRVQYGSNTAPCNETAGATGPSNNQRCHLCTRTSSSRWTTSQERWPGWRLPSVTPG